MAYYKYNRRVKQRKSFEQKLLHIVKKRRKSLPREGVRKLMKSLKDEFYLDQTFTNVAHVKRAAKSAIKLYNEIRLHLSLDFKTPNVVYKLSS